MTPPGTPTRQQRREWERLGFLPRRPSLLGEIVKNIEAVVAHLAWFGLFILICMVIRFWLYGVPLGH